MKRIILSFVAVCFLALAISSCTSKPDLSNVRSISFQTDVQPALSANCSMCHSDDNSRGGGEGEEVNVKDYEHVMHMVKAGDAHSSKLYNAVLGRRGESIMPPAPKAALTEEQVKYIYLWIEQGAPNN